MILDVGCGHNPRGDVNCDLMDPEADCQWNQDPTGIPNFVKCDVRFLPFKPRTFDLVFCSHVIEHLEDEWEGINELKRVSRDRVAVVVPYSLFRILDPLMTVFHYAEWRKWEKKNHLHYWYNDPFKQGKGKWRFCWVKREKAKKRVNKFAALFYLLWIPFETLTVFEVN